MKGVCNKLKNFLLFGSNKTIKHFNLFLIKFKIPLFFKIFFNFQKVRIDTRKVMLRNFNLISLFAASLNN